MITRATAAIASAGLAKNLSYDLLKINCCWLRARRRASTSTRSISTRRGSARCSSSRPRRAGREGRRHPARSGPRAAEARRAAGRSRSARRWNRRDRRSRSATTNARRRWSCCATPNLLDRILADFARCGVVGEETNKLVGYIAAVSRHLEAPLAVMVQSSSAAGKSSLMDAMLAFVPEEAARAVLGDDRASRCSTWAKRI